MPFTGFYIHASLRQSVLLQLPPVDLHFI